MSIKVSALTRASKDGYACRQMTSWLHRPFVTAIENEIVSIVVNQVCPKGHIAGHSQNKIEHTAIVLK
jgi:hypothetical protein